jgi:hypothetical protein
LKSRRRVFSPLVIYENVDIDVQVRFVESSFGQKVQSTFPIAQYRIESPFKNGTIVVCLRKTNTNSFILSRAYINNKQNL